MAIALVSSVTANVMLQSDAAGSGADTGRNLWLNELCGRESTERRVVHAHRNALARDSGSSFGATSTVPHQ